MIVPARLAPTPTSASPESTSSRYAPVVYLVGCACPAVVGLPDLVADVISDGWRPCVILTPSAVGFLDAGVIERLEETTGYPVRSGPVQAPRGP